MARLDNRGGARLYRRGDEEASVKPIHPAALAALALMTPAPSFEPFGPGGKWPRQPSGRPSGAVGP